MKKTLSILVLFLLLIAMLSTTVHAMTADELANKLYEMGKPYGLTEAHKARLKNDLAATDITDEKAEAVIAKAQELVSLFKEAGVTDYTKFTNAQKEEAKDIAIEGGAILDLKVTIKSEGKTPVIQISKDGKVIDELPYNPKTDEILLADTGVSSNIVLVVSSIAVVALVAVIAIKKFANA